ncbi:MAG: 6-carboxytetrahydropterin synthase [Bacteroidales bacterium]|nr:6-carboxytetrahydropterin synthase [Bacteroidales bacterium]
MAKIRITKKFDFEMAHALWNYDGACKNIHGHSYKLFVTVRGEPVQDEKDVKNGMVMDFGDLKKIVNRLIVKRYDHCVVVSHAAPHGFLTQVEQMFDKYELTPFQPTSENLLSYFVEILTKELPDKAELVKLQLYETENSYAEWLLEDNL